MIDGKRILAVVPARGGSKGLPRQNLKPINGRPLVAMAGDVVRDVPEIDRAVVSTDDEEIAEVAEAAGLAAPFRRPEDLSGDRIGDLEVLSHALLACEELDGVTYDVVTMLQPTSPLRRPADVLATLSKLVSEGWDAVWTVSETDSKAHPRKQLDIDPANGALRYDHPEGGKIIARQQLGTLYHRNGAAYAFTRECLLTQKNVMGARTAAVVLPGHHISIDTEWDLKLVEFVINEFGGA